MILDGDENGKHTDMILTDLQEVFNDTSDYKILLHKMKCIGFSGKTKRFHFYLTTRAFFV